MIKVTETQIRALIPLMREMASSLPEDREDDWKTLTIMADALTTELNMADSPMVIIQRQSPPPAVEKLTFDQMIDKMMTGVPADAGPMPDDIRASLKELYDEGLPPEFLMTLVGYTAAKYNPQED